MDDLYDFDKQSYEAADTYEDVSIFYEIGQLFVGAITIIKFILLSIITLFKILTNLLKPTIKKKIAGQLALVTGGANGLGRAISLELAKNGCNVAILDVDIIGGEKTAANCRALHVNSKAYKVDISNYDAVKEISSVIEDELGPVDILINNAALLPNISLHEGTPNDIERIIKVNFTSHLWTVRIFIHSMIRRRKGHIVAISSAAGIDALGRAICYSATKYGVKGFMDALYEEFTIDKKIDHIHLTTVFPRFIKTRQNFVKILQFHLGNNNKHFTTPEVVAEATINGIINNKRYVTIPGSLLLWYHFISILPTEYQEMYKRLFKPRPKIIKSVY